MANPVPNFLVPYFLAPAFYLAAAALVIFRLFRGQIPVPGARLGVFGLGLGALVLHGALLYPDLLTDAGPNLALPVAFSLVAWIVVALYLITSISKPVDNIGVFVLPLAALTVFGSWYWSSERPVPLSSPWQAAHIVISLLAYSLLCLAAVQSVLLLWQERGLKQKHSTGVIRALPPMETTEAVMFQMITLGFALLTLTVVSGVVFSEALFGKPFQFTHHTVLATSAWVVYAILLLGRWRLGWRGRAAIRWTIGGFLLLVLAYFGSKFVLEVVLGRG
jgi:ABC-type uncharacterized transport system permease subunit